MEDSRTGFRIDSRISKLLIIMGVSEVSKKKNKVLLGKKKVLKSLQQWVNNNHNNHNNHNLLFKDNLIEVLAWLEVFLINHLEIGLRVSRVVRYKVQQLHLNQHRD